MNGHQNKNSSVTVTCSLDSHKHSTDRNTVQSTIQSILLNYWYLARA